MRTLTSSLHTDFRVNARRFSPPLATLIEDIGPIGYQRRRTRDLGTHLARVIVGQQLSTFAARAIWTRVEAATAGAPRPLEYCVEDHYAALKACGLSNNKVKALIELRKAELDGRLNARHLARLPHLERSQALTALWGLGPWTADMVSMFYFHAHDIWPLGDLAVRKTFERFAAGHARYSLEAAAALFAPHRSFLALYMWRIANNGPDE